ncbi:terminase large subunit [Amycolatopsis sp. 195334CR]|uniref:terminase large subunit n=1 Tax=Amycolatopsis sp. 195334CR TaxID=2814588 RepID=UPI001A8C2BE0|nr:terminase large subunit [Amycolatopsis sp. 195334CR]MBN6037467.1 terminase [Amycolatopsis sp. 195334CR]
MTALLEPPATSYAPAALLGRTEPRIWTPPLRELTSDTSYGYDVCTFARDVMARPLDPWQEFAVIHGGELLPDGRPRFRTVLMLVARQNGKTDLLVTLSLFWLYVEQVRLVLGMSTNLDYAKESWEKAVDLAESIPELAEEIQQIRRANGEQFLRTVHKSRYKIAASNRKGGRSLTINRLIADELREHHDWSAYNAAMPAMNAVADAQAWLISNQGDDRAVVLDSLRKAALQAIADGTVDSSEERLGLFEWSAPDGSRATDVDALAQANPNLGRRIDLAGLLGDARRAEGAGGEELAGFKTEILCMRVPMLDPAIDSEKWAACLDPGAMPEPRSQVALCFDVSIDGRHATLAAAAVLPDGRVRVEIVAAWTDMGEMRRDLRGWVRRVGPGVIGWFPSGPAAAYAAVLTEDERGDWPPKDVVIEGIRADVPAVCMGFADLVSNGGIAQSGDPLLDAQAAGTEKLRQGDTWRFTRRGAGHCDATYSVAGATHLARTLPEDKPAAWFGVV